jgi:hypothetical protein
MSDDHYAQFKNFIKQIAFATSKLKSGEWDSARYHQHFMYFYEELGMHDAAEQHKELRRKSLEND